MSIRRFSYSVLLYVLTPLVLIRLLWRSRKNPAYRKRISERFAFIEKQQQPLICVHAVSVGEAIAAKPLIEGLIETYPDYQVLVTTTTPTGSDRVNAMFSQRVQHVYLPYDLPDAVGRFLKRTNPSVLIVMETEIWPNLYAISAKKQIPVVIVNARLSQKSTQAYQRIKGLIAETLSNVKQIAVRSEDDASNFKLIGAKDEQISVMGNIKYDFQSNPKQIEQGKKIKKWGGVNRKVLVAASTHEGEDEKVLELYSHLYKKNKDLILVIIPRHPERFDSVYEMAERNNKALTVIRHSETNYEDQKPDFNIIIGDTMGEMQSWLSLSDVVFMGGSLVETGGHNPLEATAFGIPVVSGPHMFNFEDITADMQKEDLLFIENDENLVLKRIENLLFRQDEKEVEAFQEKAEVFMQRHRGVTASLIQLSKSWL